MPPEASAGYPLSAWQRRLHQGRREDRRLELTAALDLPLDTARLAAAVSAVGRRCEILRTFFRELPGLPFPLQVVAAEPPTLKNGDHLDDGDAFAAASWLPHAEGRGGTLTLRADPRVADRRSLRLWLAAILRELDGGALDVDELPLQYADFAAALDEMKAAGELDDDLAFWQSRPGFETQSVPCLRPATPSGGGMRIVERALPASFQASGLDPGELALAALRELVGRLAEAREGFTQLGIYADVRAAMALDSAMGPMSDWLPLATGSGGATWRAAAAALAEEIAKLRQHQAARPWVPGAEPRIGFVDDRGRGRIRGPVDDTPLVFLLADGAEGAGLVLRVEHDAGIAPDVASDLLARWAHLLEHAAANLDASIAAADLFLPGEPTLLTDPSTDPPAPALPAAFFERALAAPEAPGVLAPGLRWSYGRLAAEVAALAGRLMGALGQLEGGQPPLATGSLPLVALRFEPGADYLASALAVWSVGAAFLPIDADAPEARVAFLLEDAGVGLLVHGPGLGPPAGIEVPAFELDPARPPAGEPVDFSPQQPADEAPAYLLYTSGSTGQPNGVRLGHGGLRRYLRWVCRELIADLGVLPVTSRPTFDASLKQLFAPLLLGRPVVFPPAEAARQPSLLLRFLADHPRSAVNGVPSLARALADAAEALPAEARPDLGALLLGGAALPADLQRRLAALWPRAALWNLYGLTETTANSLAIRLDAGAAVTLGRPLAGALVAVVDGAGRPLPPLAEGEIWIGGPGLALGYQRRPELDAARFATLEVDGRNRCFLRTGDRGFRRPDGTIAFLGRRDDQLEVRGYRIERGEVEAALLALDGVAAAVVDRRDDADGGHLIAFLEGHAAAEPEALRPALARRLPAALIPSQLVGLAALPRLPSGKVDRRALEGWSGLAASASARPAGRAPSGTLEEAIAATWSEVLGAPAPDADTDFFTVGGHSLLMARLVRRLGEKLAVELSLAQALEKPTVAGLAALADQAQRGGASRRHLVTLRAAASGDAPACVFVHPSSGSVRAFYGILGCLPPAFPVLALQAAGLSDAAAPLTSVPAMAAAYLGELEQYGLPEPWLLVGWSFGGLVAYEMARQRPEAIAHLLLLDSASPDLLAARRRDNDECDHLQALFGRDAPLGAAELRRLPDRAARLEAIRAAGVAGGRFSPETRREELDRYLRVYEANVRAGVAYAPGAGSGGPPCTLIRAADETLWNDPHAAGGPPPPDLGWSRLFGTPPRLGRVPGRHETLFDADTAPGVARAILELQEASKPVRATVSRA